MQSGRVDEQGRVLGIQKGGEAQALQSGRGKGGALITHW